MRLAVITTAVLVLITQFNTQQPILEPNRVAKSDKTVATFVNKDIEQPQFPDRQDEHQHAVNLEIAREASRLQAIEAEKQAQAVQTTNTAQNTPTMPSNDAKMFIYMKESGNNPQARNSGGCLGLGQACPGSKLLAVCPSLDYACQDAFFTNYAISRYGSWEGAYQFWIGHNWW